MLQRKAECNYRVAVYAEENEHFDAAVSRYYYYIFQNVLVFLKDRGKRTNFQGMGSKHQLTINELLKYFKEENLYKDNPGLTKLWTISVQRNSSDYKNRIILSDNDFDKVFKNHFIELENTLKKLNVLE